MSASILFLYLVWIVLFSVSKSDPHFILKTKQILKPILAVSSTIHSLFFVSNNDPTNILFWNQKKHLFNLFLSFYKPHIRDIVMCIYIYVSFFTSVATYKHYCMYTFMKYS
jgi:hypothetical protein